MTGQECRKIIEKFANKNIKEGTYFSGHGISAGRVLQVVEKIPFLTSFYYWHQGRKRPEYLETNPTEITIVPNEVYIGEIIAKYPCGHYENIVDIWKECGAEKSLQTILDEAEWQPSEYEGTEYLKKSATLKLFKLLDTLEFQE